MKLLVATKNKGKLREIAAILDGSGIETVGLADAGLDLDVVEDGDTFYANARKKALELHSLTGFAVLADDSGLAVDALKGAPGVRSARYAGECATDEENYQKLLGVMAGVEEDGRTAAFVCAMVLVRSDGTEASSEGRLLGRITLAPRGSGGFGYDPVFELPGDGVTLAEAEASHKNLISHRAIALAKILPALKALAESGGK